MDMLILDFSKAVDKVPHERLMVKLSIMVSTAKQWDELSSG